MTYTYKYESLLGTITMASDGQVLIGLWFDGQKHFGTTISEPSSAAQLPIFEQVSQWLERYFASKNPSDIPELKLIGTDFQKQVWQKLLAIPYGTTVCYSQIAREIATERGLKSMSAQAVGNAVGRNPISIIVPCHRVVGKNNSLTGYAAGIEKKETLLNIEKTSILIHKKQH